MKKFGLLSIFVLSLCFLAGCDNTVNNEEEISNNEDVVIKSTESNEEVSNTKITKDHTITEEAQALADKIGLDIDAFAYDYDIVNGDDNTLYFYFVKGFSSRKAGFMIAYDYLKSVADDGKVYDFELMKSGSNKEYNFDDYGDFMYEFFCVVTIKGTQYKVAGHELSSMSYENKNYEMMYTYTFTEL